MYPYKVNIKTQFLFYLIYFYKNTSIKLSKIYQKSEKYENYYMAF